MDQCVRGSIKRSIIRRCVSVLGVCVVLAPFSWAMAADSTHVIAATDQDKWAQYPKVDYGTGEKATLIKKGEYLVKTGDCIACHTNVAEGGKPFAGGFPMVTPFGTIYTPNITSDKTYGIGTWSDKDFIKALHEGISPQGTYYYPAFPYLYFNRIKDEDIVAMRAYLNAVPAVHVENRKNTMMFPFNWRFLQLGWRILFFQFQQQGVYVEDKTQSDEWNRGAYLVQGLAHCGMCHTPMWNIISEKLPLAAPKSGYFLAGGALVDNMRVPNINSEKLKDVPDDKIVDVFEKCQMIEGGDVAGSMLELDKDSLQYLNRSDLLAIARYIKTVKSKSVPVPKVSAGSGAGAQVYASYCSTCHAMGAAGAPKYGDGVWNQLVAEKGMDTLDTNAINGLNAMPAKGTCSTCTDQQIKDAVTYMVDAAKGKSSKAAAPIKQLTYADGKALYEQYCSVCHDGSYKGAPKLADQIAWKPIIDQGMEVVFLHSIDGYKNMPVKGSCSTCNDAEVMAAVKYMVHNSKTKGDYSLW